MHGSSSLCRLVLLCTGRLAVLTCLRQREIVCRDKQARTSPGLAAWIRHWVPKDLCAQEIARLVHSNASQQALLATEQLCSAGQELTADAVVMWQVAVVAAAAAGAGGAATLGWASRRSSDRKCQTGEC